MNFVCCTQTDGLPIYVIPTHIAILQEVHAEATQPDGSKEQVKLTRIVLQFGQQFTVIETPKQVLEAMQGAINDSLRDLAHKQAFLMPTQMPRR